MKDKILQLAVECGFDMSVEERFKRLYSEIEELDREIYSFITNFQASEEHLKQELADVYITSILLCSALGIDFDSIVADKIEEVRSRYTPTSNED